MRGKGIRLAWIAPVLVACASTSPQRDLARVEELARTALPTATVGRAVSPAISPEALQLLKEPLTADRTAAVALLQNRELRALLHEVSAARGRAVQAATFPNPSFQFDLRHANDPALPLQSDYFLEYDLTRALLTPARGEAAEAEVQAEQLRAAAFAIDLGYRARVAFYALRAAQQKWALANRALDALAAGRDAARALRAAGTVAALDLATREAAYEEARTTAAAAELDAIMRREALQRLLALHGPATGWKIATDMPEPQAPPEADDVEGRAVESSLVLAEMKLRLTALARRTGLTRAEGWIPGITVDLHLEQDQRDRKAGGGATVKLPIFDRRQGDLAAVEAEFDALAERYEGVAAEVRSAAREARDRLRSAYLRARQHRSVVVPARRRVVAEALRQVDAMVINVFDLLRFQRDLLDAEVASCDAQRDYWTARAAFDALAAGGGAH